MIMQLAGESDIGPLALDREEEDYKEISHSDTSINVARWATFRDSEGRRDSEYSDVPDEQRPPLHISLAGGVSPPPSPPTAASPAPTMAPGHGGSSPVSGLATLHHALHGLHNLHNLHNLQNFHNLQQNLQTQMAALAGLQGGLGVPGVGSLLHPPLAPQQHPAPAAPSPAGISPAPPPANGNNASAVPQMVLTSGHVTQGVQGAQLLIPTSQGIAVQPILTIPLGQAGVQGSSSLVNPLVPLHHLQHQGPHPQHTGSATSFEKLDITPKSAQKIKPVLERWMQEAEDRYKNGQHTLTEFMGTEPSKKRKRRTSFTPQALEVLNGHFERNTHPSGAEITALAEQLGYEREVVRIWF
ncbi:putative POU domain protein C, partial [Penaeus vannamei]